MVIGRKTADCPPHAAESLWFQGLAPVVHQKNVCPIVGRQIGPVHRNSLNVSTESSRKHLPIRLTPVEVDARFHSVQTAALLRAFHTHRADARTSFPHVARGGLSQT
jgi:hypothetical protein